MERKRRRSVKIIKNMNKMKKANDLEVQPAPFSSGWFE